MPASDLSRRSLLAGAAGAASAASAGCLAQLRSRIAYDAADQVSLTLKTVPADRDPGSILIGQELRDNISAVGIDVAHQLLDEVQLLRDVFINHDYDLFITELPGHTDPDELRTLLHSTYAAELGGQNPYGFASAGIDDLLRAQSGPTGRNREAVVGELLEQLLLEQPFVVIASRHRTSAVADDLTVGAGVEFGSTLSYLVVDSDERDLGTLNVGLQRPNVAENRNVLAIEYRLHDNLTDLCYDPLVRRFRGQFVPWLASEFSIDQGEDRAEVRLRPDLRWHDGIPLTADDVAFTYRFLKDTALGELDSPVPAPRFRQQSSLVESVTVQDERTLELELTSARAQVAPSALTAPILPEHTWRDRSSREHEYFTHALVHTVEEPVGSGPLRFGSSEDDTTVTFRRFDDHFLQISDDLPQALEPFAGAPVYRRLVAEGAPNVGVVLEDIAGGEVDVLDGNVPIDSVADARSRDGVRLVEADSPSYYVLGMNSRRHPLSNYAFRAALARLLDRSALVETVFDGMARPTETPLHHTRYVTDELRWDGESSVGPFPGEDGNLDADAARELFRAAGFRYHEGTLRGR